MVSRKGIGVVILQDLPCKSIPKLIIRTATRIRTYFRVARKFPLGEGKKGKVST